MATSTPTAKYNDGTTGSLGDLILIKGKDGSVIYGSVLAILPGNNVRVNTHAIPLNASNAILIATAHAAATSNLQAP